MFAFVAGVALGVCIMILASLPKCQHKTTRVKIVCDACEQEIK
jgi:hypothetical protein